jgi:uncharacterized membrane protein YeaQ/YmgE (transglycosylase-associated protein family)
MGLISWIILGLIAGFIASKIVKRTGSGLILDLFLGMMVRASEASSSQAFLG